MSKWMKNKEKMFSQFKEKKQKEKDFSSIKNNTWKTPDKGTTDKAKTYILRLLSDKNDNFYVSYYYHMFKNNRDKWVYTLCPKTHNYENYCPLCAVAGKLFQGSAKDKKAAYTYMKKTRHCVNAFIVDDPRDTEAESDEDKNIGKVLIYEFPPTLEGKIKNEMTDEKYGSGISIFDPGEDGCDFILKVKATKPIQDEGPNKGKQFPEYSESKFSNKSSSIGTDKEIKAILESTYDLNEHLKDKEKTEDEILEIVKDEMLYELIESDYPSAPKTKVKEKEVEEETIKDEEITEEQEEAPKESEKEESSEDDISDEDLLKELDDL